MADINYFNTIGDNLVNIEQPTFSNNQNHNIYEQPHNQLKYQRYHPAHHNLIEAGLPLLNNYGFGSTLKRMFSENYYRGLDAQKRPRLVKKCGELNIHMENVPKHKRRLLSDFFNTVLDIKWRWHIVIFFLSFLMSWFFFASIWYLIAYFHGDLNESLEAFDNSTSDSNENTLANVYLNSTIQLGENKTNQFQKNSPCVYGVHDFTSALLYSVETQHTIGYGFRHITEECSFAIVFLMLQSCFGIFVQGLVAGVVFAKISRPSKRKRTIIFSHNAVVSKRDGKLSFMFKVANIRNSQLSDARIKLLMIKSRRTSESEFIPFQSYDMSVGHDWSGNESIFFPWPKTVEHVIDENSPLYGLFKNINPKFIPDKNRDQLNYESPRNTLDKLIDSKESSLSSNQTNESHSNNLMEDKKYEDYEIVVILEGNIETTGASCHIRTSYLPQEILFGYRFVPIYPKFSNHGYLFDYSKFDQVEPFHLDLLHLNVAFNYPHLNHVFDGRDEEKNYQLTYLNTLQQLQKTKPDQNRPIVSLSTILSAFKINANNNNQDIIKSTKNEKSSKVQNNSIGDSKFFNPNLFQDKKLSSKIFLPKNNNNINNLNNNEIQNLDTISTLITDTRAGSPLRDEYFQKELSTKCKLSVTNEMIHQKSNPINLKNISSCDISYSSEKRFSKNGRFTIVPVSDLHLNSNSEASNSELESDKKLSIIPTETPTEKMNKNLNLNSDTNGKNFSKVERIQRKNKIKKIKAKLIMKKNSSQNA